MAQTPLTPRQNLRTSEAVRWFERHGRNVYSPQVRHRPRGGGGGSGGGSSGMFPVLLSQTGGSAGSGTAACNFTYLVKDLAGNTLAAAVAPSMQRPALGLLAAAAIGLAYWSGPFLILWWCDEVPAAVKRVCP